ncbi:hypothetical protein DSO57_1033276 [Entomophthora muscae]|uniref:Uncharacterized protein n=1 Tax=Entomophthora muscae TaxID=34485 RepID=A0ACC2TBB2_9FUNG|nr:hypothetical protein DSO57_1033276 [Entomophthora muscae]
MAKIKSFLWFTLGLGLVSAGGIDEERDGKSYTQVADVINDSAEMMSPQDKEGSASHQYNPGLGGISQQPTPFPQPNYPQQPPIAISLPQTPPILTFPLTQSLQQPPQIPLFPIQQPPNYPQPIPIPYPVQTTPSIQYPIQTTPAIQYPSPIPYPQPMPYPSPSPIPYPQQQPMPYPSPSIIPYPQPMPYPSPSPMPYPQLPPIVYPQLPSIPYPQPPPPQVFPQYPTIPNYPPPVYPLPTIYPVYPHPPIYPQPSNDFPSPINDFPAYPADNFHMVAESGTVCQINGNPNTPCRGKCPPCWMRNPTTGQEECYEKSPRTSMCQGLPGMRDQTYLMPQITPSIIRFKGCFRQGDRQQPCFPGSQCPPCWSVDYRDQAFQCFEFVAGTVGMCPPGLNSVSIRPLSYLPFEQNSSAESFSVEQTPSVCYINGNLRMPCSGNFCPPCWDFNQVLNAYTCRDFIGTSMQCGGEAIPGGPPATVDTFKMMIYSRPGYFRTATCYHGGMLNYPCQGNRCPPCWRFNFISKRASCYARIHIAPNTPPICPPWDGMMDLVRLGVFPPPSGEVINIAEDSIVVTSIVPPPLVFPEIPPQYSPLVSAPINMIPPPLITPLTNPLPIVSPPVALITPPVVNPVPIPLPNPVSIPPRPIISPVVASTNPVLPPNYTPIQQQPYPYSKKPPRHQKSLAAALNATSLTN